MIKGDQLCTIRIGGEFEHYFACKDLSGIKEVLKYAGDNNLKYKILGNGSNLVLPDSPDRQVLIKPLNRNWSKLEGLEGGGVLVKDRHVEGQNATMKLVENQFTTDDPIYIEVGAGMGWGELASLSLKEALFGPTYFARIPCNVGGAIYNNIHGGKRFISEFVHSVVSYDPKTDQEIVRLAKDCEFDYDLSIFHKNDEIITSVIFKFYILNNEQNLQAKEQYFDWIRQKTEAQPSEPNCGSVFKNLMDREVASAGWYIDQSGMKGFSLGNLQVSNKHANFIINNGGATCKDFIELVELIREKVWQKFSICLEPEVEVLDSNMEKHRWQILQ